MSSPLNRPSDAAHSRLQGFLDRPRRALWSLSLPIMVGMSIQTLYMVVDMIFVGRVSGEALTALAFNMPLVFLAMGATFGLGTGVTALIARAVGARDGHQANAIAHHALGISLALTAGFVVPGLLYGPELLGLLGVPDYLLADAWSYFRIIVVGFPFMVSAVFLRSILSGEGEVKLPVAIQAAATLVNLGLDPVFIFGLGLGVAGAALATVVAQALSAAALAYLLFVRRRTFVQLRLARFPLQRRTIADIFSIGAPASASFIVMSVGGGIFNRLLVDFTADAVAAHQVGMRIDHIVVLPMVAIGSSLVTLVGMFLGAGRSDLVLEIVRYAMSRAVVIALAIAAALYASAPAVVGVFTNSPEIRELGVLYVRIAVFAYPWIPISMLTGRILQGLGRGGPVLLITLLRVLLIAVPLAWLFTHRLHLPVQWIWIAMVTGSFITASIAGFWLTSALKEISRRTTAPAATPAPETA